MSSKREFPDDWYDMPDEQALENIRYLKQNLKKYKLKIIDDNTVSIDNVKVCSFDKKMDDGIYHRLYTINKKIFYNLFVSDFSNVCGLYSKCRYEIEKQHRQKIKTVGIAVFIVMFLIADVFVYSLEPKIQARKNKEIFKQEIIEQYQQNKDSLIIIQNQR